MKKLRGIYLGAGLAYHPNYDIIYQDINGKRDLDGDMLSINLKQFDYIICTPPCNFWSRARGNKISEYALKTKHLLPDMINKLKSSNRYYLIENVVNFKRYIEFGILPRNDCYVYKVGRHIYFTNVYLSGLEKSVPQRQDFKYGGHVIKYDDMNSTYHQGGYNVFNVIEFFLKVIHNDLL